MLLGRPSAIVLCVEDGICQVESVACAALDTDGAVQLCLVVDSGKYPFEFAVVDVRQRLAARWMEHELPVCGAGDGPAAVMARAVVMRAQHHEVPHDRAPIPAYDEDRCRILNA